MNGGCFKPDELAGLASEDPRRGHLKKCPRCRSVLKSFAAFEDVAVVPGGADVAEAHARLSAAMEGETGPGEFGEPEDGGSGSSSWAPLRVGAWGAAIAVLIGALYTIYRIQT